MRSRSVVALFVLLGASTAFALTPGAVVDNFNAIDHQGTAHTLYATADRKAIVLMVQGNGCPIVRLALPGLKDIRSRYQQRGVEFLLLNSNLQDTREISGAGGAKIRDRLPDLARPGPAHWRGAPSGSYFGSVRDRATDLETGLSRSDRRSALV